MNELDEMMRETAQLATRLYEVCELAPEGEAITLDANVAAMLAAGFLTLFLMVRDGVGVKESFELDDSPAQFH